MGTVRPADRLRSARAFSLVEMLTVIVIIGILGSMITAAVIRARIAAQNAAIKVDIGKLESALGAFKEKFGDYPPDFTDKTDNGRTINFLVRTFPRFTFSVTTTPATATYANFVTCVNAAVSTYSMSANNLNPTNALVFWLGGLPTNVDSSYSTPPTMTGFSANAGNPFESKGKTSSRIGPFFEFDLLRLKYDSLVKWPVYAPPGNGVVGNAPYVYFRAIPNTTPGTAYVASGSTPISTTWSGTDGSNPITPYWSNTLGGFAAPTTFQIISAGLDGKFGYPVSGAVTAYGALGPASTTNNTAGLTFTQPTQTQLDNITNFTKATTIDSEK